MKLKQKTNIKRFLKCTKKTDEEKEQFLIESEEFEEIEDTSIDILTSEESKENEHKQRAPKQSEEK